MHRLDFTALRYGNVYGPRQDLLGKSGVLAIFAHQILLREPVRIDWDSEQQKDYVGSLGFRVARGKCGGCGLEKIV